MLPDIGVMIGVDISSSGSDIFKVEIVCSYLRFRELKVPMSIFWKSCFDEEFEE